MLITRDKHIFAMDKNNTPAAKVALPCRLTFETLDCFSGQIKREEDTLEGLDFDHVNPATGPVYLEGVQAGDVLAVHIREIRVNSPGIMVAAPGAGVLGDLVKDSQTLMVPVAKEKAFFKGLELPIKPMIGVIGVAPAEKAYSCGTPEKHGGNMDTTLITAGATLYLPVQVDGGLLAMGDLHAAMGDGEIMVSGVEVAGEVDVTVTKVDNLKLTNPMVKTEKELAFIVSAPTLDAAVEQATVETANFLANNTDLTLNEAGMLMSACGNAQICQVVDPLKTARFTLPLEVLRKLGLPWAF